ncbi:MAG: 30S ribosomal protein S11, small subunit ribosomal protein S11 [Candidatus Peregrinibacteria bacterium GW2011_GWF2_33_10]|nr:MAG: 30S ribosomal protein S11, small subunit ribosomal protein S11 [Candidatus Peregrinibacteria bacterium GW2011_GWF2_33_10]OGJ46114.1 MAG: 30S ribosomal protein S11 [Candidatus Peregrinibacteria bacterium RIFOXYA12_FULL_33_12]OGJ46181.1 MAG: 30S ribosomal protein S11 [Candidatus Peregrinibacteria bacterium RIFOXYA2_FULL_33_21]OGJ51597.1 MAG: 30S ribosomal protein S11 [Candidatus Peregrinibacteria bacterium RIFOXYB2_FULL_33_20]
MEQQIIAKKRGAKKKKVHITDGKIYVTATFNNTIVTITDLEGNVLTWASAGSAGFKGTRRSTPYAGQIAAENVAEKAKLFGLERAAVFLKGAGPGREQAMRGLNAKGIEVLSITDITPTPHNGCRKRRTRRV